MLGGAAGARGAALERAALVLAQAAPHAGVLVGLERVLEAHLAHGATGADRLRLFDLVDRGAGVPDGEEQLGVSSEASGIVAPVHSRVLLK